MSNMTSLKSALEVEIKHAKEGMAFYSARIATLEKMVQQLDQLDNGTPTGSDAQVAGKRKYTRSAKTRESTAATNEAEGSTAGNIVRAKSKLPATTAAFWTSLLSEIPISNKDIITAAIATLKIRPTPTELKKLKQRLANAITIMTKDGSIMSDGSGRARRFFVNKTLQ